MRYPLSMELDSQGKRQNSTNSSMDIQIYSFINRNLSVSEHGTIS